MSNLKYVALILGLLFPTEGWTETELETKCNAGDHLACKKDFQNHFVGVDGVTRTSTWWNGYAKQLESSMWQMHQMFNGFAIFRNTGQKYAIAVKGVRKDLHVGDTLRSRVECMKYGGNADIEDDRGMPLVIRIYEVVDCPEGL